MIKNELVGKYWKAHKEGRHTDGSLSKEEMAGQYLALNRNKDAAIRALNHDIQGIITPSDEDYGWWMDVVELISNARELDMKKGDKIQVLWDKTDYFSHFGDKGKFVSYTSCGVDNEFGFNAIIVLEGLEGQGIVVDLDKIKKID